jgi:hypothetical protein
MNISSYAASSNLQLAALQQQSSVNVNSSQRSGRERENDGDRDGGTAAVKAAAATVNLSGQTVGTRISVTA